MDGKVIIYGKGGCPYTDRARKDYGDRAEYVDVEKDASALQEMMGHAGGKRQVPVIVAGGKVTVGYGGT